jgi:AcrR family transcriptional regulator
MRTGATMTITQETATFQRARRPEQREVRRQAILEAAESLLAETPVAEVSLREISRRVGQAKSSVVRYFETREAIFLELLYHLRDRWTDDLEQRLTDAAESQREKLSLQQVTDLWAQSLAEYSVLCDLWSVLSSVLERNVSADTVRAFKLGNSEQLDRLAALVHAHVPILSQPAARELAASSVVLLTGLWPFANPSPAVREATEDMRLAPSRFDFATMFSRNLYLMTLGLTHRPLPSCSG